MSDQSSGGFSPFSFFTRLIGLGYEQVDLRDAERMYSDLTGLDVSLNPRQTQTDSRTRNNGTTHQMSSCPGRDEHHRRSPPDGSSSREQDKKRSANGQEKKSSPNGIFRHLGGRLKKMLSPSRNEARGKDDSHSNEDTPAQLPSGAANSLPHDLVSSVILFCNFD